MLARLGTETEAFHADADSDVDRFLFRSTTSIQDYRLYLQRIYGFISPLETALAACDELDDLIDLDARAKSPLIVRDLLALGMTMRELAELPQCLAIPSFRGAASALGWMYVGERPLLASSVIRRHIQTRLPGEGRVASAYLSCYAGTVGTMWRELGNAVDRVASTPAIADRVVVAAGEAFRALNRWRAHDLGRLTARAAS